MKGTRLLNELVLPDLQGKSFVLYANFEIEEDLEEALREVCLAESIEQSLRFLAS